MSDKDFREELQILKAASLTDAKGPVKLDTKRARSFVAATLGESKEKTPSFLDSITGLFTRPAFMLGGITAMAVACAVALMVILPQRGSDMYSVQPQIQSVHASLDSLACESDTSAVNIEEVEIISVD